MAAEEGGAELSLPQPGLRHERSVDERWRCAAGAAAGPGTRAGWPRGGAGNVTTIQRENDRSRMRALDRCLQLLEDALADGKVRVEGPLAYRLRQLLGA